GRARADTRIDQRPLAGQARDSRRARFSRRPLQELSPTVTYPGAPARPFRPWYSSIVAAELEEGDADQAGDEGSLHPGFVAGAGSKDGMGISVDPTGGNVSVVTVEHPHDLGVKRHTLAQGLRIGVEPGRGEIMRRVGEARYLRDADPKVVVETVSKR